MVLDYLTLLYILLIGGGIVLILVLIRFFRNKVWSVATDEDGLFFPFGIMKKNEDSGAAQIFWVNDTSEPAIGQIQYKDSVGKVLFREENATTTGKHRYKKIGYVDAKGYLYQYGKTEKESERIGYLAAPSAPNVPTLKGERSWRDLWWSCRLNAYLGDPEAYVAPPQKEKKKKKGKKVADLDTATAQPAVQAAVTPDNANVFFFSERIPEEKDSHVNQALISEISDAIDQVRAEKEAAARAETEGQEKVTAEAEAEVAPITEVETKTGKIPVVESETQEDGSATAPENRTKSEAEPEEEISEEEERHISNVLEYHQDVIKEIINQFVLVEGGSFMMGTEIPENINQEKDGYSVSENEGPVHKVTLSNYYIGKYPVTQRQWTAIMGYNPSEKQDDPLFPVAPVNWDECALFAKRVKRLTGLDISLPTEAQWEYAARGGKHHDNYIFSGSDQFGEVGCDSPYFQVGSKKPNSLGVYDMSGLVREWCKDWYELRYTGDDLTNPEGPSEPPIPEEPRRVVRSPRGNDTVTNRKGELPTDLQYKSYGLRIVCNSELPKVVHSSGYASKTGNPPVLVGQGMKTGWLSGNTIGCPLTLESRAAAFSALFPHTGDAFSERISEGTFSWKDTALFSSLVFAIIFLTVYFINVGILEYPLLGNDFKAVLIFSAFFFIIWAVVRTYKIYTIESGHSIQPFFNLFNKSLEVRKLDRVILILSIIVIPLSFFSLKLNTFDFLPLFIALALGSGINSTIGKNRREWEVSNPLTDIPTEDNDDLYDRKTGLLNKPEGDVAVEYNWELQSFTPDQDLTCSISFWFDRELIESERIMNPFYMENPKLRNKPSVFKNYVGKMVGLLKSRPDMNYHIRFVLQEIIRLSEKNELSEIDRLQIVLDFVQTLPFVKDCDSKTISKPYIYVRFPDETLFDNEGDCNCKAFLAASMFYLMGYDVLYASSTKLGHTVLGLKLPSDLLERNGIVLNNDNTLEYNNRSYVYCETSHSGFKIGETAKNDSASKFDVIVEYIHEDEIE